MISPRRYKGVSLKTWEIVPYLSEAQEIMVIVKTPLINILIILITPDVPIGKYECL